MSQFKVLAPDPDPALTGFSVEVSSHKSVDAALSAAKDAARAGKKRAYTVQVEEDGTQNVWTVQYHPEPPVPTGAVDEWGVPAYAFPLEFRVVHDGREEKYEEKDDGNLEVLGLEGRHEVTDVPTEKESDDA